MDPSHRITFVPSRGLPLVYLVRLRACDQRRRLFRDLHPTTADEWWSWSRDGAGGAWLSGAQGWSCSGGPTPHWRPGQVVVEPLQPCWSPTAARWQHHWPPLA
jgi:hypothetical protein